MPADEKISALPAAAALNGTEPIPAVQGGSTVQTTAADIALTLANTAVTPSTYGDATHVGQFTVDAKGRLTFAQDVAISGSGGMAIGGAVSGSISTGVLYIDGSGDLAQDNPNGGSGSLTYDFATSTFNAPVLRTTKIQASVGAALDFDQYIVVNNAPPGIISGPAVVLVAQNTYNGHIDNFSDQVWSLGFGTDNTMIGTAALLWDPNKTVATTGARADTSYHIDTPMTGGTVTIPEFIYTEIIDPAGTLATLTINLPSTPTDGQIVRIKFSQIITALTLTPNTGDSVRGAPASAALGGLIDCQFMGTAGSGTWYC